MMVCDSGGCVMCRRGGAAEVQLGHGDEVAQLAQFKVHRRFHVDLLL
jgi:hypothetical protein